MDVASAAPSLPFFYYHLPGTTKVDIPIAGLMQEADTQGFDQLMAGGVKYVGADFNDFLNTANWVAAKGYEAGTEPLIVFAPEPKLQGFALQSPYAGAILAEDFYAPTCVARASCLHDHSNTRVRSSDVLGLNLALCPSGPCSGTSACAPSTTRGTPRAPSPSRTGR